MPCGYAVKPDGLVSYWEEAVCELSLRSNCYCYSLNAQSNGGYCIPGYVTAGSITVSSAGWLKLADRIELSNSTPP